jgi:hypothetical protein
LDYIKTNNNIKKQFKITLIGNDYDMIIAEIENTYITLIINKRKVYECN